MLINSYINGLFIIIKTCSLNRYEVFFMSVTIFIISAFIYSSRGFSIWQYQVFTSSSVKIGATYEMHTNWFGMIALGNSVASLVGFFLFKDKK